MQHKTVRQILAEGYVYGIRVAAVSLAVGVLWHLVRGGGPDLLGLRLVTAAFAVSCVAVFVFGGGQAGVTSLLAMGLSRERVVEVIRDEIRQSEAQRFHPLQALLGAAAVAAAGVVIMLVW